MSLFTKVTSAIGASLVEDISDVADKWITTTDEKKQFELETERIVSQRMAEVEETTRTEINATAEIIKAELTQDDLFTKRARPSLIYGGMLAIVVNYIGLPLFGHAIVDLPEEFFWAWGGAVGVYTFGRSQEKAARNKK